MHNCCIELVLKSGRKVTVTGVKIAEADPDTGLHGPGIDGVQTTETLTDDEHEEVCEHQDLQEVVDDLYYTPQGERDGWH